MLPPMSHAFSFGYFFTFPTPQLENLKVTAETAFTSGQYIKAEPLFKQYLAEIQKLGENTKLPQSSDEIQSLILNAQNNLAETYAARNKLEKACELHKKTLQSRIDSLGANHPATLTSYHNLANTYIKTGNLPQAKNEIDQAVSGRKKAFGKSDPRTLTSLDLASHIYFQQGDIDSALKTIQYVIDSTDKINNRHQYYSSLLTKATFYFHNKQQDKSIPLFEQGIEGLASLKGENHISVLESKVDLALALRDISKQHPVEHSEDLKKSISLLDSVLQAYSQRFGPTSDQSLNVQSSLSTVLVVSGHPDKAKKMVEFILPIQKAALGPQHPNYLKSLHLLGVTNGHLGDFEAASKQFQSLVEILAETRGKSSPQYQQAVKELDRVKVAQSGNIPAPPMIKS